MPLGVEKLQVFDSIKKKLSYEDKRINYQYLKWLDIQKRDDQYLKTLSGHRNWLVQRMGREAIDQKVAEFKAARHGSCLKFDNEFNRYYTYSGLQNIVEKTLSVKAAKLTTLTPDNWGLVPWVKIPFSLRDYQQKALDALCPLDGSRMHGAVAVGTGLGKSLIIASVVKRIGLRAIVVVPTLSIANQMLDDFISWFGKGRVGQFFDSKHQSDKLIVIAVAKSLMNIEKGTEEWNNIYNRDVVLCDESHTCPPDSLASVMFGLLENIPYRYFFSGTQFRNDGLGLLLQGITNDVVFEMSVAEGIKQGYLAPLKFFQYRVASDSDLRCDDAIKMNKVHVHQNDNIYKHAAILINRAVQEKSRRVLVLVDGIGQYQRLLDGGLKVPSMFAHGGVTPKNRKEVPKDHWKSDPMQLVKDFDAGKFPVLVGTSCIGMGTDTKSADLVINIVGMTSEIEVSQGVGRGTRLFPGKKDCIYVDYDVYNIERIHRHAEKRIEIFNSIYGNCKILEAKC